jgi:hypothetical protein
VPEYGSIYQDNYKCIIELLNLVLNQWKLVEMKKPVKDKPPEQCNFIDSFEKNLGWNFFEMAKKI